MKNKSIIIILVATLLIVLAFGLKKEKQETQKTNEIIEEQNKIQSEENEEEEKEKLRQEKVLIDKDKGSIFIQNCTEQKYLKDEKELNIPILIYHNFRTPIPYAQDTYKLFSSQENFEENVTTLLDNGYTFITLNDIELYNLGKIGLPEKNICITVDDGQIGCYTDMFPILQKYNIPATIFIVNTLVGTEDYFSWEQAKEMYDTGLVKIHCHGYSHSDATNYSKDELVKAYNDSYEEIIEKLEDKNIQKIMAYPAGSSNKTTIQALKDAGFDIQVQTRYGVVNKSSTLDLTNLGRVRAERATGEQILKAIK